MGRRTSKAQLVEIIKKLRTEIPDIALRTTLITGFPGETEEDHEEVLDFVDQMEFDRLGVFTYSPEENTPAAVMPDQVPEEVSNRLPLTSYGFAIIVYSIGLPSSMGTGIVIAL
jgi:ribosomal protein S12 methylthiotransferase